MKTTIYSILAAAACGMAFGQTAYTTPVGYLTVDVPANADTTVTPGLTRSPLHAGASTGISGDDVSVTGLTAGSFASPNPACYLKVTSGPLEGAFFPITANTSSTITVEAGNSTLQALGFLSGNSIKVIPYWTLNTLFPAGAGVGGTADALAPTSFVLESDFSGTGPNRASGKLFFYCTGDTELDLPAGWYDNADPFAGTVNDTPIDPTIQYTIRSVAAASVVVTGEVPATDAVAEIVTAVTTNDNYMAAPYPIDISLQESGLQSVIAATSDALAPTEFVFVYDDAVAGFNKSASAAYFYCSGDTELDLPAGWYDNADPFAGVVTTKILKAGRAFIVRKAPGTSGVLDWTAPVPYTP
jgi:uncharacterized protein (TIGR02597 family)